MTSTLSTDFEQVSYTLPASQRGELADYIYFLQEHDKKAKSNIDLQKLVLNRSNGTINWSDVAIMRFKNTQSSSSLPEGEQKQLYLLQILRDRAKDLGHDDTQVIPAYEGLDHELFNELVKIFGVKDGKAARLTAVALSDFISEFKDCSHLPLNIDKVRSFINAEGQKEHKLPINVREALLDFTKMFNNGEIKIRPNVLLGAKGQTLEVNV